MLDLIKLEYRQGKFKKYSFRTLFLTLALLGFYYLFAFIPNLNPNSELEEMVIELTRILFSNYANIVTIINILGMFGFSVFSASIFSKNILDDYIGKRRNLLLSYPIEQDKLFLSKLIVSAWFSFLYALGSGSVAFLIFFISEKNFQLVTDVMPADFLANTVITILIFSVLSISIGLISLYIGFLKSSIQTVLIASYIIAAIFSNVFGVPMLVGSSSIQMIALVTLIALIVAIVLIIFLSKYVKSMEAE